MKIKKIHFVGIKGVGMTPLAIIAKQARIKVTGSDISEEFITDEPLEKEKITPYVGFKKKHITDNIDLVITTGAHGGFDNIEVKEARRKGIKVISKGEGVGVFMSGRIFDRKFEGISVAGSHGKTTVAAMVATILKENNLDPSYLIGTGMIPSLGSPGHYGLGKFFVSEADEYATEPKYDKTPQFLWQYPKIALFTNIELDHPDVYKDVNDVRTAFLKFSKRIEKNGLLICCGDDPQNRVLLKEFTGKYKTYGFSPYNDFLIEKATVSETQTFFWLKTKGMNLGEFTISIPGKHNALNAAGSVLVALELGLPLPKIKKALLNFKGTKRRFEYVGKLKSGALAFDDYAHHPTEIRETLATFQKSFPKHKIICIFQPHTYSRTKKLFEEFVNSFKNIDSLILVDIFPSQREKENQSISSKMLADRIKKIQHEVLFLPKISDVVEYVGQKEFRQDSILVSMGAGDVYKIWKNLL